ncbi:MAG: thioredoxin family protein [Planctomycetaceae bacterium]|nr:MAG: thioredoxin family protein [Planctomycetaceae bacterium]
MNTLLGMTNRWGSLRSSADILSRKHAVNFVVVIAIVGAVWPVMSRCAAGEYNEVLSIGDAAPTWERLPGTDGRQHGLAELAAYPVVVVVFTCVSCPTAVDYEDRLQELAKKYAEGRRAAVVAICVNRIEEDRLPALTKRAERKHFVFQYLYDESQQIARQYGAIFTPECFVLDRERRVVYMGAFDDSTDPAGVQQRYVEDAVEAALRGELPKVRETIARGCRVRYARERRASE